METIDYILDFVTHLGREMIVNGATIENVKLTIETICKKYNLREVSVYVLSTFISVSARENGKAAKVRQISIPGNGIHLEKLRSLNDLSHKVCNEKPNPLELEDMLYESLMVSSYPRSVLFMGYFLAMGALCRIFGGNLQDIIVTCLITCVLIVVLDYFSREKLNRIITNVVSMFLAGTIALFFTYVGFARNFAAIIITNAFFLIPGIPMVNATGSILCGNEMNGILEMLKVILEVLTIVVGLYTAYFFFGRSMPEFFIGGL